MDISCYIVAWSIELAHTESFGEEVVVDVVVDH